jgi:hypothetical protein
MQLMSICYRRPCISDHMGINTTRGLGIEDRLYSLLKETCSDPVYGKYWNDNCEIDSVFIIQDIHTSLKVYEADDISRMVWHYLWNHKLVKEFEAELALLPSAVTGCEFLEEDIFRISVELVKKFNIHSPFKFHDNSLTAIIDRLKRVRVSGYSQYLSRDIPRVAREFQIFASTYHVFKMQNAQDNVCLLLRKLKSEMIIFDPLFESKVSKRIYAYMARKMRKKLEAFLGARKGLFLTRLLKKPSAKEFVISGPVHSKNMENIAANLQALQDQLAEISRETEIERCRVRAVNLSLPYSCERIRHSAYLDFDEAVNEVFIQSLADDYFGRICDEAPFMLPESVKMECGNPHPKLRVSSLRFLYLRDKSDSSPSIYGKFLCGLIFDSTESLDQFIHEFKPIGYGLVENLTFEVSKYDFIALHVPRTHILHEIATELKRTITRSTAVFQDSEEVEKFGNIFEYLHAWLGYKDDFLRGLYSPIKTAGDIYDFIANSVSRRIALLIQRRVREVDRSFRLYSSSVQIIHRLFAGEISGIYPPFHFNTCFVRIYAQILKPYADSYCTIKNSNEECKVCFAETAKIKSPDCATENCALRTLR